MIMATVQVYTDTDLSNFINVAVAKAFKEFSAQQKPDNTLLSQKEAAQLLKISMPTLQRMKEKKLIPFAQVDKKIYFRKQDILNSIQAIATKGVKG